MGDGATDRTARPTRRRLLACAAGVAVAGCLDAGPAASDDGDDPGTPGDPEGGTPTETDAGDDLSEACPTTQGLGVEWPETLDAESVASFVETYEYRYVRDVVVGYEPESRFDAYEMSHDVREEPTERGDGWVVEVGGGGAVYTPHLAIEARTGTLPEGREAVPVDEIDGSLLSVAAKTAAEEGEASRRIGPGESAEQYADLLADLDDDFGRLASMGDTSTLYVDVDGTTVEVTATVDRFHGDYGWEAEYYVDETEVRRSGWDGPPPEEGELLECRTPD